MGNDHYPVSIITITPFDSARNLSVMFDASLPMSDPICSVSTRACFLFLYEYLSY